MFFFRAIVSHWSGPTVTNTPPLTPQAFQIYKPGFGLAITRVLRVASPSTSRQGTDFYKVAKFRTFSKSEYRNPSVFESSNFSLAPAVTKCDAQNRVTQFTRSPRTSELFDGVRNFALLPAEHTSPNWRVHASLHIESRISATFYTIVTVTNWL